MKRSTLVAIIVGLITFIGAVAGTLYYLKKRGIIFIGDEYECEFEDVIDRDIDILETKACDIGKKAKKVEKKIEKSFEAVEEKIEDAVEEAKSEFGF